MAEQGDADILCPDESSARAEAARRQAAETAGAEWIYLHRDRDSQWVVRRWSGQEAESEPEGPAKRAAGSVAGFLGEVLNPLNWIQ